MEDRMDLPEEVHRSVIEAVYDELLRRIKTRKNVNVTQAFISGGLVLGGALSFVNVIQRKDVAQFLYCPSTDGPGSAKPTKVSTTISDVAEAKTRQTHWIHRLMGRISRTVRKQVEFPEFQINGAKKLMAEPSRSSLFLGQDSGTGDVKSRNLPSSSPAAPPSLGSEPVTCSATMFLWYSMFQSHLKETINFVELEIQAKLANRGQDKGNDRQQAESSG
ncbi:hypothetical protein P4O66_022159, partial [Electrophorus voltai]